MSKLDAAHARPFRQAAAMYASPDEPIGAWCLLRFSFFAALARPRLARRCGLDGHRREANQQHYWLRQPGKAEQA